MLCNIYESQPVKYYLWWFSPKYFLSKLRQNEFIWRVVWLRKNKDDCNAKFADSKLQTLIFACFQLKIEKVLLQDWLVFKCKILMFIRTEWCINILYRKFQPKSIIGSPLKQLEEGISCFFLQFLFLIENSILDHTTPCYQNIWIKSTSPFYSSQSLCMFGSKIKAILLVKAEMTKINFFSI